MKMLAVVDVSGSMKTKVGTSTRMELAYQAGLTALAAFPPDTQLGLWQFGYRLGGPNQDWLEVVPIRTVTEKVGGVPQGELLRQGFQQIAARPAGGTGLYDTVYDAYKTLLAQHDKTRVNALVLLTDGKNEDPYSRTLPELLSQLRQLKDPAKPMPVILVGVGPEADMTSLQAIAEASGGHAYQAITPDEIIAVFVQAMLTPDA